MLHQPQILSNCYKAVKNMMCNNNVYHVKTIFCLLIFLFLINADDKTAIDTLSDSVSIAQDTPDTTDSLSDTMSVISFVDSLAKITDLDSTTSQESIDTTFCNWNYPFWSFGAGWELGSLELFNLWQSGLQDELLANKLREQFNVDSTSIINVLSADKEEPAVYNVTFPLSLSITPFVFEKSFISLGCSFSWIQKYSRVPFKILDLESVVDTSFLSNYGDSIVNFENKLSLKTLTFNLKYNFLIPDIYFNIEKIRENYLILGVSGSPLVILREWNNNSINLEETINSYGISAGWLAGLSTFRRFSSKSSLEMGFVYAGSWQGRFMDNDHHRMISDINNSESDSSEVLQYVSHRFILYFNMILGKRKYFEQYKNQKE